MIPDRDAGNRAVAPVRSGAGVDCGVRAIRTICMFCLVTVLLAILLVRGAASSSAQSPAKPYALIFGTVFGPDNRPLYGVLVKVRRADKKKAQWEMMSDHQGEFAQRVPAGPADYIVWTDVKLSKILGKDKDKSSVGEDKAKPRKSEPASAATPGAAPVSAASAGAPSGREVKVRVENDERIDIGLHLIN
jgi:hypothetical protein